jgi:hypothetical protein
MEYTACGVRVALNGIGKGVTLILDGGRAYLVEVATTAYKIILYPTEACHALKYALDESHLKVFLPSLN